MATFECDSSNCTVTVDVGGANPSLVICADCNGFPIFNCVDAGNHSCDCIVCEGPEDDEHTSLKAPSDEVVVESVCEFDKCLGCDECVPF